MPWPHVCIWLLLLLLGGAVQAAEPLHLQAGKLSLTFEPDTAFARAIHIGPHKVLQGISAPVRDQYWGTVKPQVQNLKVQQTPDAFQVTFDAHCQQPPIDFLWHGTLEGRADGTLTYTFDGEAQADFLRNRIGFCVLHGPEVSGRSCTIETVDGEQHQGSFPEAIAPHQPFKNLRAVTHPVAAQVFARVLMEGDTFEMEDQRNWTDASFKTYCTPLALPYPVMVPKGTRVQQKITVSIDGMEHVEGQRTTDGPVVLSVDTSRKSHQVPGLGLQVSSQVDDLTVQEVAYLRALKLDHLRVDVVPQEATAAGRLRLAALQAKQLQVPLLVGLILKTKPAEELQNLLGVLQEIAPPQAWILLAADESHEQAARQFLQRAKQPGQVGRGENTNFTELNRSRPDAARVDLVAYGINPQIHAFDDLSIVETLEIQGETVRSARQFIGDRPLYVSPITLKSQTINEAPPAGELPPPVDPRQLKPFTAAWTMASVKYLAEAGADSATYFETVGWLGIMEQAKGSPLPDKFPSQAGEPYPVYYVLRELSPLAGQEVFPVESSDPLAVVGLAVKTGERPTIYVANLSSRERTVQLAGTGGVKTVRSVVPQDAKVARETASEPHAVLTLAPHQVVVVETE